MSVHWGYHLCSEDQLTRHLLPTQYQILGEVASPRERSPVADRYIPSNGKFLTCVRLGDRKQARKDLLYLRSLQEDARYHRKTINFGLPGQDYFPRCLSRMLVTWALLLPVYPPIFHPVLRLFCTQLLPSSTTCGASPLAPPPTVAASSSLAGTFLCVCSHPACFSG